jgi:trimethylamine--corrinoid protein Co-methyltransferase
VIKLTETRASIQPIKSKLRISILDDDELEAINQTARDILEEVGIMIPSEKALGILADAGADVNLDKKLVRIPAQLVDDSLKTAPRRYTLCGRRPELDADIGGEDGTYFYCSGEAPKIVDLETGERRHSIKSDVANMAKVADYLPIVSLVWPTVSANDKGATAPLHGVEACFNNTEKHIQTESVMDEISAGYAIEMASVVAGGRDQLKKRPLHSLLLCAIAPLAQDYSAGSLATALAEVLSGCVLTQIVAPGTPNFVSIIPSVVDPRTANYFMGSSPAQITSAAAVQLAHSNGLPITACLSFGGSQWKLNNWQAGIENLYVHLLAVMAGADMSFGPSGMIEAVSLLDMRRILFDREILQVIDIITNGFEVNDTTLAFDMIREVGPRGIYLAHRRTAKEVRKLWPPSILFEPPQDMDAKYRDPVEIAHEAIEWILKNHQPAPLPEDVRQELARIVATAEEDEKLKKSLYDTH